MNGDISKEPTNLVKNVYNSSDTNTPTTWGDTLLTNLAQLLKVKSLLTLTATAVFAYLCIVGKIEGKDFMTVFMVIVSFFFGVKSKG